MDFLTMLSVGFHNHRDHPDKQNCQPFEIVVSLCNKVAHKSGGTDQASLAYYFGGVNLLT